jgi:hypothetical protein
MFSPMLFEWLTTYKINNKNGTSHCLGSVFLCLTLLAVNVEKGKNCDKSLHITTTVIKVMQVSK